MSKKIVGLVLAIALIIGGVASNRTPVFAGIGSGTLDSIVKMFAPRFLDIEKDIASLKAENLSLREEVRLLKEAINKATIIPHVAVTPAVDNIGAGVAITKKYIRYKNSIEVYDAITGRHISWREAFNYNIWDDVQDLPYTK